MSDMSLCEMRELLSVYMILNAPKHMDQMYGVFTKTRRLYDVIPYVMSSIQGWVYNFDRAFIDAYKQLPPSTLPFLVENARCIRNYCDAVEHFEMGARDDPIFAKFLTEYCHVNFLIAPEDKLNDEIQDLSDEIHARIVRPGQEMYVKPLYRDAVRATEGALVTMETINQRKKDLEKLEQRMREVAFNNLKVDRNILDAMYHNRALINRIVPTLIGDRTDIVPGTHLFVHDHRALADNSIMYGTNRAHELDYLIQRYGISNIKAICASSIQRKLIANGAANATDAANAATDATTTDTTVADTTKMEIKPEEIAFLRETFEKLFIVVPNPAPPIQREANPSKLEEMD